MADQQVDGNTRVVFANIVALMTAPTAAELNAALRLDKTMSINGLNGFKPNTTRVPNGKFSSKFGTARMGRVELSMDAFLEFFKQDGVDTIWNTLQLNVMGFVAVRYGIAADTAFAATQKVDVFAVECGQRSRVDTEPNTYALWHSPLAFYLDPAFEATVA
ncbi:hypothetical protein Ait01nite_089400 [Actinoplanes italicus]|uniref:Uncharacterized protein n=1 Tax=Actinoplanes italicus TaxID=113567 RepID=A0A2T0JIF1_9ACTN|nr:hypothetical protein [Actinoplanes italicus]PRX07356.1 hypothetical protein CLV67_14231 [Actinoplanes italicus]GIE35895.1 hypothetical protein Ait01nite_089400 [Actinoplanes italicus]